MNIPFSSISKWVPLPVDGEDVVTKVRLVVAGREGGSQDTSSLEATVLDDDNVIGRYGEVVTHHMQPVVYEYEAPEHSTYGCERSFSVPPKSNPFLPPTDSSILDPTGLSGGDLSPARDGDPETSLEVTVEDFSSTALTYATQDGYVGWRLMYGYAQTMAGFVDMPDYLLTGVNMLHQSRNSPTNSLWNTVRRNWSVPSTEDSDVLREAWAVCNYDVRSFPLNDATQVARASSLQLRLNSASGALFTGVLKIHHFYPLILNTVKLEAAAKSLIRLPHASPRRVIVEGVVSPDASHTITGWPGGDFTGVTARHEYVEGTTVIDFGSPGAPVGVGTLDMRAGRAQRAENAAVFRENTYKLLMGG